MRSLLITASLVCSISALAQTQAEDFSRLQQQMQVDQMNHQLRMQQLEIETERIRAATRRIAEENQRQEEADKADALRAEQERKREEAAQKASDEAEELRTQIHMAGVRSTDNMYLLVAVAALFAFFAMIIRRHNKEGVMRYEQKFGVILVVASAVGVMLSLMVSRDWSTQLDVLQNVMLTLRIAFIEDDGPSSFRQSYMVDIPTKFVLLGFVCVAAYGLLTYLGIVPAVGGKQDVSTTQEMAP